MISLSLPHVQSDDDESMDGSYLENSEGKNQMDISLSESFTVMDKAAAKYGEETIDYRCKQLIFTISSSLNTLKSFQVRDRLYQPSI